MALGKEEFLKEVARLTRRKKTASNKLAKFYAGKLALTGVEVSQLQEIVDEYEAWVYHNCIHLETKVIKDSWTDYSNGQGLDREVPYEADECILCGKRLNERDVKPFWVK